MKDATTRLIAATRALVDAVSFDVNGAMIAGQYRGGNGGLVSRETIARADEARRAIAAIEAALLDDPHAEVPASGGPRSTHDAEPQP